MIHQHSASFVVNLCINASVADEIDDPLLAFVFAEAETAGEVPIPQLVKLVWRGQGQTYLMSIRW